MQDFSGQTRKHTITWIVIGVVGWWSFFTLSSIAFNYIPYLAGYGKKPHVNYTLLWYGATLLWIPLTFLTYWIATKFPVTRKHFVRGILLYLFLGYLFAYLHYLLDTGINIPIRTLVIGEKGIWVNMHWMILSSKFHHNLVIFWAITGASHGINYFMKFRKSEIHAMMLESKLTQAQLQALKMQLQPHFLFNTHHSIVSLMMNNQNQEAVRMITQLSDLLRITLEKNDQQLVSLAEELHLIDLYLAIQLERFKDRLTVEKAIEPDTLSCKIPALMLQPIVENAFKHGLDEVIKDGKLRIVSKKTEGYLELEVWDNGNGFEGTESIGSGVGLKTTIARLEQLYGNDFSFQIDSKPGAGTSITIKLPMSPLEPAVCEEKKR